MSEEKLTFKEICKIDPRIERLYDLAKSIGDKGEGYFCSNEIWYGLFKPQLKSLVGWGRATQRREVEHKAKELGQEDSDVLVYNYRGIKFISPGPADPMYQDRRIESELAYDIAYDKISEALPACRSCGCL